MQNGTMCIQSCRRCYAWKGPSTFHPRFLRRSGRTRINHGLFLEGKGLNEPADAVGGDPDTRFKEETSLEGGNSIEKDNTGLENGPIKHRQKTKRDR